MTTRPLRNADMLPHPLRDYAWVSGILPGSVGPTDIDFVLEASGLILIVEFKPPDEPLPIGQRLTFQTFIRMGCEVIVVRGPYVDQTFAVSVLHVDGTESSWGRMSKTEIAQEIRAWFMNAKAGVA